METASQYRARPVIDRPGAQDLTAEVERYCAEACRELDAERRSPMGQFFTPAQIAQFMASLFGETQEAIRLLDAGAGVGTLVAAFVEETCRREARPQSISVIAYELEPRLIEYLHTTLGECQELSQECDIEFAGTILEQDFIHAGVEMLRGGLFPVERYSFNGRTQVNATDLRMLRYPSRDALEAFGATIGDRFPSQKEIDKLLERLIQQMEDIHTPDPVAAKQKVDEALKILKLLGLPRGQQNERSALTLLALLSLTSENSWSEAQAPRMGITPIMDFCREHYGRQYAPNTRETFRRQTMHQFVQAGLAVPNPDDPTRPVNSPKFCYQIEPAALNLLKTFGAPAWPDSLSRYLESVETLKQRYARASSRWCP